MKTHVTLEGTEDVVVNDYDPNYMSMNLESSDRMRMNWVFIGGYNEQCSAHARELAAKLIAAADDLDAKLAARVAAPIVLPGITVTELPPPVEPPVLPAEFNQGDGSPALAQEDR